MMRTGLADRQAASDALLDVARRETLLLAVAIDAMDDDRATAAAARLRWALGAARELIAHDADRARSLDRTAQRAERWLALEPVQPAREVAGACARLAARERFAGGPRPGLVAEHAGLIDLDLDALVLGPLLLRGSILTDVTLRHARCDGSDARATRWLRCLCDGASFERAVFAGARVEHGALACAQLEGSSWHRAALSHTSLRGARWVDARLDRAELVECDLRGADLSARSPDVASLAGARFVRCDLRDSRWDGRELAGAVFIDCQR